MSVILCPRKGCGFSIHEIDPPVLHHRQTPNNLHLNRLANGMEISEQMYQHLSVSEPRRHAEKMWEHVRHAHPLYLPKPIREAAYDQGLMRMLQRLLNGQPIDKPRAQVGRYE